MRWALTRRRTIDLRIAGVSFDDPEARVALAVALQARSMLTAQEG